jgi:adenosylcobinamide-phosphate synthase
MELWLYAIIIPVLALAIDLVLGEPPNRFHPVVLMGKVMGFLDGKIGRTSSPARDKFLGVFVVLIPIIIFVGGFTFLLAAVRSLLGAIVWAVACAVVFKTMFAIRTLETHTAPMIDLLKRGDLDAARKKASMVVSRDVNKLDKAHVTSCACETVSENLVDSVLSPLFYFGLVGVPGAVLLRTSNTADGMVGYLSEKHRNVGWASARLDDAMHFLVARISVPFIMLALALLGKDWRAGWRAARRDHGQTSSPNKGWPMATVAGGLGVKFEKIGYYCMGEGKLVSDPEAIGDTIRVMKLTAALFFLLVLLPLYALIGIHVQLLLEDWLLGLI